MMELSSVFSLSIIKVMGKHEVTFLLRTVLSNPWGSQELVLSLPGSVQLEDENTTQFLITNFDSSAFHSWGF